MSPGTELTAADREVLAHPLVGSVILFTRNYADPAAAAALVAEIQALRSPPLLVAVDQEGGRVQRFRAGFSALPPLRRIGHAVRRRSPAGLAMARALGWLMAAELLACGLDISFAPCVDLDYGLSEIIGDRAFHARAEVGRRSWRSPTCTACAMPAWRPPPSTSRATARWWPTRTWRCRWTGASWSDMEQDLLPYRRLIANGLPAVMVAHVLFPAVDPVPASFSRRWIDGVLRTELQLRRPGVRR